MSVTIDSLVPNSDCIEEFRLRYKSNGKAKPEEVASKQAACVVDATVSVSDNQSQQNLKFKHPQDDFILPIELNSPVVRSVVLQAGFEQKSPAVQGLINQALTFSYFWKMNYSVFSKTHPEGIFEADKLMQLLVDFFTLGDLQHPSKIQESKFRDLIIRMTNLEPVQKDFFVSADPSEKHNLDNLLDEDQVKLLSSDAVQRISALKNMIQFLQKLDSSLKLALGDEVLKREIQQSEALILSYLFTSQTDWESLQKNLRKTAQDVYVPAPQYYEILGNALNDFAKLPLFQANSPSKINLDLLQAWLLNPLRKKELEYVQLKPDEALKKSLYDNLLNQDPGKVLSPYAMAVLGSQNFSPEWFNDSEKLKRILDTLFENIKFIEDSKGNLQIDPEAFRFLAFQVDTSVEGQINERREFAAGYLSVLIFYFGDPLQKSVTWNLFHHGEMGKEEIILSDDHLKTLRASYIALKARLESSVFHTETNLPLLEGGLCLVGAGITAWGVSDEHDRINAKTYAGAGIAGLGCSSLITHYTLSQGKPDLYWKDLMGGGVGLLLGLGIPFALDYFSQSDGKRTREEGTQPPMQIPHYSFPPLKPIPFPNPFKPTPFPWKPPHSNPDSEGRNPSDGFGP